MWSGIRVFADKRGRHAAIIGGIAVVLVLVGLAVLFERNLAWLSDPAAVRAWIRSFGPFAPLVFVLIQASQVVIAPVPGHVLGLVSGYLFGALWGTVISVTGAVIGSYVAFKLSREFGRPFVENIIHADTLARFDSLTHERGLLTLFLVFLIPGLPDDVICFTAGLTELRMGRMVLVAFLGRLPGFFLTNLAGAQLAAAQVLQTVVIIAILAGAAALGVWQRRRILAYLERPPADR